MKLANIIMKKDPTFKEKIDLCIEYLSRLTKEEAELIKDVIKWDDELKAAYIIAKQIFEEHNESSPKSGTEGIPYKSA